ncbi:MAG TPA: glycosyltransferase family 39 protein [Chryseolinea sp.]|nr:glycosyltransferase family 39 protein [Chryseolinea sp.]
MVVNKYSSDLTKLHLAQEIIRNYFNCNNFLWKAGTPNTIMIVNRKALKSNLSSALSDRRFHYGFLFIVFALVNGILFSRLGIKMVNDSPRYLEYAQNLLSGFYVDQHNFWYLGYVVYIAFVKTLQGDIAAIIVGQYVLSFLAVIALYQTALLLWNNQQMAFLAALFFLVFFEISSWNAYVLAESVYISTTCFALYSLTNFYRTRTLISGLIAVLVAGFTMTVKPTGIALIGATLSVVLLSVIASTGSLQLRYATVGAAIILFLIFVNRALNTFGVMDAYLSGEVIYDITTTNYPDVGFMRIVPPENIYSPPEHYPQLIKISFFVVANPIYSAKLFFTKVFYLLAHVRPYWSTMHNLFSLVILLPLYCFFGRALTMPTVNKDVRTFAGIYLALHVLSIGLTTEDWDGRFLMPVLPVVFLLAAAGAMSRKNNASQQAEYIDE